MCLWAIYIFPGSVYIFTPTVQADPTWEYIISSQTQECGNWDWGPDIPFLGIFVSNFRHFVFAVLLESIVETMAYLPLLKANGFVDITEVGAGRCNFRRLRVARHDIPASVRHYLVWKEMMKIYKYIKRVSNHTPTSRESDKLVCLYNEDAQFARISLINPRF